MYLVLFLIPFAILNAKILALYLSISGPPTTMMGIQWHTTEDEEATILSFQLSDGNWVAIFGECEKESGMLVHKVLLEDLTPDTEYSFRIGSIPKIYYFRTASKDSDELFSFAIYSKEKEYPSTTRAITRHLNNREEDLFAKKDFYYFPSYPPTKLPSSVDIEPYPFQEQDAIRDSCENTRAAFQRFYSPNLSPDPLAQKALTAASGEEEKKIFHADKGTDYGGVAKQDAFDAFHQQAVSLVAKVIQSLTNPDDFSLYATLHAIGLLKLRMAVQMNAGDLLQLGRWRAKVPAASIYEDDPYPYVIVDAITPTPKETRYHRYHELMDSMLYPGVNAIQVREALEGIEIPLTILWDGGIEHSPAINTVRVIDYLEKKIRTILGEVEVPKSALYKEFACIHWWLAHLMPFLRGSASCTEILIQALAIAKGFPPPRLAGIPKDDVEHRFLFADLEAMYRPIEYYINQYECMVDRLNLDN